MTTKALKMIARLGMLKEYGFAPGMHEIRLLEADDFGNYVMIQVGDTDRYQYQIYRHLVKYETPICIGATYDYEVRRYEGRN